MPSHTFTRVGYWQESIDTNIASARAAMRDDSFGEALHAARAWYASEEGQRRYKRRAGVEGTRSQGVRAFGLRCARYRGLTKTHFQHVATAAASAINIHHGSLQWPVIAR